MIFMVEKLGESGMFSVVTVYSPSARPSSKRSTYIKTICRVAQGIVLFYFRAQTADLECRSTSALPASISHLLGLYRCESPRPTFAFLLQVKGQEVKGLV